MSTALNGSLIKALEILDLFSKERSVLSAKTVAESLNMSTATAHRFLLTLEHVGYVVSPSRGQFTLGQRLEDLGRLAFEISPLPSLARPVVETISRDLNESAMACRLGRQGPLCVASANSQRSIRVSVDVGATLPAATTAQGKLFLADMGREERHARVKAEVEASGEDFTQDLLRKIDGEAERVADQGFATNFGENEAEIAAVAVPVRGPDGSLVLTLSVFGITSAFDDALLQRAKSALSKGAEAIQASMRDRGRDRLQRRQKPSG